MLMCSLVITAVCMVFSSVISNTNCKLPYISMSKIILCIKIVRVVLTRAQYTETILTEPLLKLRKLEQ